MELNAETVKRALERIQSHGKSTAYNAFTTVTNALALITSQEQRIGAQDMTISELRKLLEKANHDADRYAAKIKELTEEVAVKVISLVEFDKQITRLTEENEKLSQSLANSKSILANSKADTVRKFAERFISELRKDGRMNYYIRKVLEQIVKEMLEGSR
jgi:uncharacterized coiled-coil DUF342 family protein